LIELNFTSLFQLLSFLLLMWFLYKFVFPKFFEIIEKRKNKILDDLKEAENKRRSADEMNEKVKKELSNSKEKAQEIINSARDKADEIIKIATDKAQEESQKIILNAEENAQKEKEKVLAELQSTVVSLAVELVSKFLETEMNKAAREQYMKKMLSKLEEEKK